MCVLCELIQLTGVKKAKAATSTTAASLWPYKLVSSLLAITLNRFGPKQINLQTNTPVTSISPTRDSSDRYTLTTPRGVIYARKIIFATNGYTTGILPEYNGRIYPVKGICSRTIVPKDGVAIDPPHLSYTYGITHAAPVPEYARDYLIPRPDGGVR